MEKARYAEVNIVYEGKDISTPVNKYLESFTYEDIASGESDRVSISMHDIDRQWMDAWMPDKGSHISCTLVLNNWNDDNTVEELYCGEFELDEMSFSGRPLSCSLGAVSIPRDEPFHTQLRTKTWENISIQQIASEIAGRASVELYYEADDIVIEILEQNEQTDCSFLFSVCEDYGLAMKLYSNRIIIFDEAVYENRTSVCTVNEADMSKWEYKSTLEGTYTGANVRFTDPNNEEEYTVCIGGGNRILEINENVDSIMDAERKGIARLKKENKKAVTLNITMKTDLRILAGTCVDITGLGGRINGKYYVDKGSTSKSGNGVCQTKLTMHRVVPRIESVSIITAQEEAESAMQGSAYTVVQGDTLWRIAKQFYGSGLEYEAIYEANKEVIESTAKARGKKDSSHGHWIFAGTVLTIPEKG
ncbi:LysM peptidoglycan-binding domain-containing protein [Lachnospiraceae bacterium]|jgi:hypothetical protein|nr:LysM peptidoglycan-binding domain-containing protein [Lachnospiraceae bacterium]